MCQSLSSLLVVAGYELNRDFITKNFCVNKAKPSLHCNGKCHLKKELSKEQDNETSNRGIQKEKSEYTPLVNLSNSNTILLPILNCKSPTHFSEKTLQGFGLSSYKPPTV